MTVLTAASRLPLSLAVLGVVASCSPKAPVESAHAPPVATADASIPSVVDAAPLAPPDEVLALVPRPRSVTLKRCEEGGAPARGFVIDGKTRIAIDSDSREIGENLARWLGLPPSAVDPLPAGTPDPAKGIVLRRVVAAPPSAADGGAAPSDRNPVKEPPSSIEEEAYTLEATSARVLVRAAHRNGLYQGGQTILHLGKARRVGQDVGGGGAVAAAPSPPASDAGVPADAGTPAASAASPANAVAWTPMPCLSISDAPRFPFRAMHLDVARNFFSKQAVERYIDLLAFYRFNVFHWHLTDDQGFRLVLAGHPELAQVGGRDGAYTPEDVREVVEYARMRYITVIPEIEMPGHARAILAAHPELSCTGKKQDVPRTWGVFEDVLCAGNERSVELMNVLLMESAFMFPARMMHIGGDEVPTKRWAACPKCRAAMKKGHIDANALEGLFLQKVTAFMRTLQRRPLVWDEAMSSGILDPNAIVFAWQSAERGREAAQKGYDVVMAPSDQVYFNLHQSLLVPTEPGHDGFIPWNKVWTFDPIPPNLDPKDAQHILGAEGTLWSEHIHNEVELQTMALPRLPILAEILWSSEPEQRRSAELSPATEADFVKRLGAQLPALDASNVKYFVEPPTGLRAKKVVLPADAVSFTLTPPRLFDGSVHYTLDGSDPTTASPKLEGTTPIDAGSASTIAAVFILPSGVKSDVVRQTIVRAEPRAALATTDPVAAKSTKKGAVFLYLEGDFHRLPDFDKLAPIARTKKQNVDAIDLKRVDSLLASQHIRMKKEHFAIRFDGVFRAPKAGVYHFVVRADDGVKLEIDREVVLEDDGEHVIRDADGSIALAEGAHTLRLSYFQGGEGNALDVKVEAADGSVALQPIHDFVFSAPVK